MGVKVDNRGDVYIEWQPEAFTEILWLGGLMELTKAEAEKIAATARGIAPVRTGNYRDHIKIEQWHYGDRPHYAVIADVPYALKIESRQRVLKRAAVANGIGS